MNPPFESAAIHIRHGMKICPMVCALLRLTFLEAGQEKTEAGRARIFCMDSFPPARVHVFRERLPMMHREGWAGPRSSSTTAYAWFVWDGDHDGPFEGCFVDLEQSPSNGLQGPALLGLGLFGLRRRRRSN